MRILGLDPGTVTMGYGVIEGEPLLSLDYGAISLSPHLPLNQRLLRLYEGVSDIICRYQPQEVAIEEPFVSLNKRSALAIGRAQGIALLAAARYGLPAYRYSPAEIKKQAASYGASSKEQVQEMVRLQLGLDSVPQPTDAADALAVALCHYYQSRFARTLAEQAR